MAEIDELEKKRSQMNQLAEEKRYKRDELNSKARHWVDQRDMLNAEVRELINKANEHKRNRDEFNNKVKEMKVERDKWNRAVNELMDQVNSLKREKLPKDVAPLGKLKRELKDLEFRQMTSVMTKDKEQEIIDLLSRLQNEIKRRERELEQNDDIKGVLGELHTAKDTAEDFHRKVGENADNAQKEHDSMFELYEKRDEIRKKADEAQEHFIEAKVAADEEHKQHIEYIREVHDYDKLIFGLRQKERKNRKETDDIETQKSADDVYERFKNGEKLSTEDLMTLQRAGKL